MTFKQAIAFGQTVTAKLFWMVIQNGGTIHLYECRAYKLRGEWVHEKRFAGWKDKSYGDDKPKQAIRCDTKGKRWKPFWLASELTRTDWKVEVISNEVKILLTQKENYHKVYKV
jgi:hypothetical protein